MKPEPGSLKKKIAYYLSDCNIAFFLDHCPALISTIMAYFSTSFAVVHGTGMVVTFLSTCVAYIGAHLTNFLVELSITCEHFGCQNAYVGTFEIESYAA